MFRIPYRIIFKISRQISPKSVIYTSVCSLVNFIRIYLIQKRKLPTNKIRSILQTCNFLNIVSPCNATTRYLPVLRKIRVSPFNSRRVIILTSTGNIDFEPASSRRNDETLPGCAARRRRKRRRRITFHGISAVRSMILTLSR